MSSTTSTTKLARLGLLLHAVGLVLTLGTVAGAGFGASALLSREWSDIRRRTDSAKNYLATAPEIRNHHTEAVKRKRQEEVRLESLMARIPTTPQESEFLAELTRLARDAKLKISDFKPAEVKGSDSHAAVEIVLKTEASYEGLCRFLDGLSGLPRLCHVKKLSLKAPDPSQSTYPVDMTLQIFFLSHSEKRA
jgi:Tfp pilus assembly protein PilO